jgi:uncharacterized alkaline shock family protein YloU
VVAGKTIISDEVFVEVSRAALAGVPGVAAGSEQKTALVSLVKIVADKVAPQINVKKNEPAESEGEATPRSSVSFDLKLNVYYGENIPAVVANVRDSVKKEVEGITGYAVERIDVMVEKLVKPAEVTAAPTEEAPCDDEAAE